MMKKTRECCLNKYLRLTYALTQDRNYDNFLYQIGAAKEARRRAVNMKPTIRLTMKDKQYTLTTNYGDGKEEKITFEIDVPMTTQLDSGEIVNRVFTAKGGKLEETLSMERCVIKVTRLFTSKKVTVTMESDTAKCQRFYEKLPKLGIKSIASETSRRSVSSTRTCDSLNSTY